MFFTALPLMLVLSLAGDIESFRTDDILTVYSGDLVVLKTGHYVLEIEGTPEEAEAYGDLIEEGYKVFKKFLKASPKRGKSPVRIKLFSSHKTWTEALDAEGQVLPPGMEFVHYNPDREVIYLHRMSNDYWTRKMMLYAVFQQFHRRCKAKNDELASSWFVHGLADALSTHHWDGKRLHTNMRHNLFTNNRGAVAVSRGVLPRIEDGDLSLEDLRDIDARWAMVAYLLRGDDGEHRKRFEKLALGSRGSMLCGRDFANALGGKAELAAGLHRWLESESCALHTLWGVWVEEPNVLRGMPQTGMDHTVAFTNVPCDRLAVRVQADQDISGGVLLDWVGPAEYIAATVKGTLLSIQHIKGQRSTQLAEFLLPWPNDDFHDFVIEREGAKVSLAIGKEKPGSFDAVGDKMGLFVEEGDVQFKDLKMR